MTQTAGNPFFLEESVRTLAETGRLVGAQRAYRLGHALPPPPIPATVQTVLAARIDRLPPDAKRLLHTAASDLPGVDPGPEPAVNSVFPCLPPGSIAALQAWSFFWDWDRSRHQVRWMTAWDTDPADVTTFATGVRQILARSD